MSNPRDAKDLCGTVALSMGIDIEDEDDEPQPKLSDILWLCADDTQPFRTQDNEYYVDVPHDGQRHTWPLLGEEFSDWLAFRYHRITNEWPNEKMMKGVLRALRFKGKFKGEVRDVFMRIAWLNGKTY